MNIVRFAVILIALSLVSCDAIWTSNDVCDCHFSVVDTRHWSPIEKPPPNYDNSMVRAFFDSVDQSYGSGVAYDHADVFWYRRESGETVACVVYESSMRVNGLIYLPADLSDPEPTNMRILGVPFGRERSFWEGCAD